MELLDKQQRHGTQHHPSHTEGAEAHIHGRSAFYKYKDAVQPFQNMKAGRIITFYTLLKDTPGALSNILSIFANSGANILTINQTIPTNGCAGVTVTAETSEMHESLEEMMTEITAAEGVLKFEILAA